MVLVYWALAFIVASAIPQVQTISGLVAAVCIMQFTYTFPPLFLLAFTMQIDAAKNDPGDSWRAPSRWVRGFMTGNPLFKLFNVVMFLGALAMACLGMYGSGKSIQATFALAGSATRSLPGPRQKAWNSPLVIGRQSMRKAPTWTARGGLSLSHPSSCAFSKG